MKHLFIILSTQATPEGRVFGLDQQTLVQIGMQMLNFLILAVVLTYILYKPVKQFLNDRTNRIQANFDEAEKQMAEANNLISEYNQKIDKVEDERRTILKNSQDQANEERRNIITEAKREADAFSERSRERIEVDRQKMEEDMQTKSVGLASMLAHKYLTENINEADQDRYFEQMLNQMEESSWPN